MKKIVINGSKKLSGTISISGAKNSVVALLPACILTAETVRIENVPKLSDTKNLEKIINLLGAEVNFDNSVVTVTSKNLKNSVITSELSTSLRASYYFMGALLGRLHHVEIYFPGGCKIGARPIDIHINGFKKMGASVIRDGDKYILDAPNLHGANIYLDFPSVGATINLILAAVLASGTTKLENAAKEPEIINIVSLLNNMGAKITGAGTDTIEIVGVKKLHGAIIETIPDRIEAGTYIMIGVLTGNDLKIINLIPKHLETLFSKLRDMNAKFEFTDDGVITNASENLIATDIKTLIYPGFPTDLGQPMAALLTQCDGTSNFEETIYESRNGHFSELVKMGANIEYTNNSAVINGKTKLVGTDVTATDLRAGAALIIAGLIAEGTTKISNIEYILRGYEDIVEKLKTVGADIEIIDE